MGRVSDARERLMEAVTELIWAGSYGRTTIDHICERAGVKKGSFYYFFDSKSSLAEAAVRAEWDKYRPQLDRVFSPTVAPLERIRNYCEMMLQEQVELKAKHGYVLGCPMCTLGAEVSTQEAKLRATVQEIMNLARLYLETAIRDAHAAGVIQGPDADVRARIIYAYMEGLLTQARIQNNVELLQEMFAGACTILGASLKEVVA
jgi:TetR/AcrR family transcriptional regulator, transcriptional repressor for nem operon